jgi:hypothetical protein
LQLNNFFNRPNFGVPQGLSQQGAAISQPQLGASQPQAGSTAQPESQALSPQRCPNSPAEAVVVLVAIKAKANKAGINTRRIVISPLNLGLGRLLPLKSRNTTNGRWEWAIEESCSSNEWFR